MRYVLMGLLAASMVSCRGKQGDAGVQGLRGPGDVEILTGVVPNNDFTISDGKIKLAKQVTVYLNASGQMAELPYFLPGSGVNAFDVVFPATGQIEIVNGALAGGITYTVVLII